MHEKSILSDKGGVTVTRVTEDSDTYILKFFSKPENRREIANYRLLNDLGVRTLPVLEYGDDYIKLADIEATDGLRLATKADLGDTDIASRLAQWYKCFHKAGKSFLKHNDIPMYSESARLTIENLNCVKCATSSQSNPFWSFFEQKLPRIRERIAAMGNTFAYNDFYFCNMVVDEKHGEAFMFDYNLMGKDPAVSDLLNVTCSLGGAAAKAFLNAYGEYSDEDMRLYELLSDVIGLSFAIECDTMPDWGRKSLDALNSGRLIARAAQLL